MIQASAADGPVQERERRPRLKAPEGILVRGEIAPAAPEAWADAGGNVDPSPFHRHRHEISGRRLDAARPGGIARLLRPGRLAGRGQDAGAEIDPLLETATTRICSAVQQRHGEAPR